MLAALLSVGAAPPRAPLAAMPIARLDLPWWRQRFEEKQARLREGHVDLVFYGDSITQDWEHGSVQPWDDFKPAWERYYGDRNAVNLGFSGDTTASLLWRVEHGEAEGISPKVAVVLIGANNLGRLHWSGADTLAGIDADVAAIRQRLPRTKILLLGILPSERSEWATATTLEVNQALAERYAGRPDIKFLDVRGVFMKDGKFDRTQFLDIYKSPPEPPLHPTAQAQAQISAAMEPVLAEMLGDRRH